MALTEYEPGTGPEQALAWLEVAHHPALQPAYDADKPLLHAVLELLTQYEKWDDQRVAAEEKLANAERELVGMLDSLDDNVDHEQIYAAMRQLLDVVRGDRQEVSL